MIAQIIAFIIAIAKASQAFDSILRQLTDAYTAYRTEENKKLLAEKNARNAALVAAAGRLSVGAAADSSQGPGQHGGAGEAPAVPSGGEGGAGVRP